MILTDLNGNIKPPEGYTLARVYAKGGFIVLDYERNTLEAGTLYISGVNHVTIYVNDMSREVLRTADYIPVLEQTMDWSTNPFGQQAGHRKYPYTWKEIFKFVWRRLS